MSKKRILVCDDNQDQYNTLEAILGKKYEVRHCAHYRNLERDIPLNSPIQLLIFDLHYRGEAEEYGGYAILPSLIEKYPALKIVVYSRILTEYQQRDKAITIARELLRYKQVVAFLSSADAPAKVEFEVGRALGGPEWLRDDELNMLHLSDLQFGGEGLPGDAKTLALRVGEALESYAGSDRFRGEERERHFPGLVLITGDLTQHGRPAEFKEAASFVSELSRIVGDQATEMVGLLDNQNVILIPGNHDVNWDILRARSLFKGADGIEYRKELNADNALDFLWQQSWLPYCDASNKLLGGIGDWVWEPGYRIVDRQKEIGVIFVCVNSSRWGVTHLSQKGSVAPSTWLKIQEHLRTLDSKRNAIRILLIHHSLGNNVEQANRLLLTEAENEPDQLVDLLSKSCGFSVVMTGHIHDLAAHPITTANLKRKLFHVGAGTARSSDTKPYRNPQFIVVRICEVDPDTSKFKKLDVYPFQWDGKRFCAYAAFGDGQKTWERFELDT